MDEREELWRNHDSTLANLRQLAEIRLRLLAVLPTISGLAIGLATFDLAAFKASPLPRLLIGILGFIVTLGVTFYDQHNSQLYIISHQRKRRLEKDLFTGHSGEFEIQWGRTFRFLWLFEMWHGRGLALIYGSVLGAWLFPVACGILWMADAGNAFPLSVPKVAALLAAIGAVIMICELQRLASFISRADTLPGRVEPWI
ncbi:MAG: hypothetical protein L0H73_02205 [Nitrococcus sp.]|nr:hypothetical protein [Nitrococcus sp.]